MTTTPHADAVLARVVDLRAELQSLAKELPAVARVLPAADLMGTVEVLQESSNLLGACDAAVVAEVDRQGVHETFGATSTAALLAWRLRVRPAEATRRVTVARACAERVGFSGEVMPPLREHVAAAQADGDLSSDHAVVIARVMDRLPVDVPVDELAEVEAALVEYARSADPTEVAACGREVIDRYDPDGPEPRDEAQRRRRSLRLWQRDNGMGVLKGDLPADLYAKLRTVLSALAVPQTDRDSCAADGTLDQDADSDANGRDTRTPAMRLCDALEEVVDRVLRSGTLPDTGGVPATVAVTIPLAALEARTGQVHTDHGGTLSAGQLLHLACEAEIIPVVLDSASGIVSDGRTKRLATADQTKALRARDQGCSFPGCRRPPEWCQGHHVKEWLRDDGPTDLDNLTLLCARHHHAFDSWGWTVTMEDGVPWWTPPAHLDPEQKPIRNHAHHRPVFIPAA